MRRSYSLRVANTRDSKALLRWEHTEPRLSTVPRKSHTIEIGCGPRARMDRLQTEHITMKSLRFVHRLEQGTLARLVFRLIYSSVRDISIKYTTRMPSVYLILQVIIEAV